MNGFVTTGKKKKEGEVVDELDRSLEGMEHSDDQFDRSEYLMPIAPSLSVRGGHERSVC